MEQNLLSILVSNHFGVLMRVTTIFSRRTCNIKALTVAETQDPQISRMTILFEADPQMAKLMQRALQKQEDVLRAELLTGYTIGRELLLVKVKESPELQRDLRALRDNYNLRVLSEADGTVVVEFTGDAYQTENFVRLMDQYGIVEVCRTGTAALAEGRSSLTPA